MQDRLLEFLEFLQGATTTAVFRAYRKRRVCHSSRLDAVEWECAPDAFSWVHILTTHTMVEYPCQAHAHGSSIPNMTTFRLASILIAFCQQCFGCNIPTILAKKTFATAENPTHVHLCYRHGLTSMARAQATALRVGVERFRDNDNTVKVFEMTLRNEVRV